MNRTTLSTAELRKSVVAAAAVQEFARGGYHSTTTADVARAAKIPAYVIKLFPAKEQLFATALEGQRFIAHGQLCHLIVTAQVDDVPDAWARLLTEGIRHPG